MTNNVKRAYLALLVNAAIWGAALPLVKLALEDTSPFRWLFFRYLIAFPVSIPLLIYALKTYKPKPFDILKIFLLELVGTTLVLSILYKGLSLTSGIEASLIGAASPVFITIGGIIFLREKEEKKEYQGLIIAFLGTLIIAAEPLILGKDAIRHSSFSGNLLILLHNVLWAAYLIMAKKFYRNIPKMFIAPISFLIGLLSFSFISLFLDNSTPLFADLAHPNVLLASLYMGILGSVVALTLYLWGQSKIEASEATLFTYLQPFVAIPLAFFLLKENVTLLTILAMAFIAVGVYRAEKR